VSGGNDLGHSCVVQHASAYSGPCIVRSSTPVTNTKFDLQKL